MRDGGGPGGILSSPTQSAAVTQLISADASRYTWAAAAVTSNQAAGYQLAVDAPVMAVGGFNGTDPAPTLAGRPEYAVQLANPGGFDPATGRNALDQTVRVGAAAG